MNQVALVTGSESLTGRKLIEQLLAQDCRVIAPVADRETDTSLSDTPNLTLLTWNRASWFSAKTVVRESLRLHGRIDAAWIIHRSADAPPSFLESDSSSIETVLEHDVKGSLALIRDLLPHLQASAGFLAMVIPQIDTPPAGPMAGLARGAFIGFTETLIRQVDPSIFSCGISGASPSADSFTAALIRLWHEKPPKLRGRCCRCTDRRRPFPTTAFSDTMR